MLFATALVALATVGCVFSAPVPSSTGLTWGQEVVQRRAIDRPFSGKLPGSQPEPFQPQPVGPIQPLPFGPFGAGEQGGSLQLDTNFEPGGVIQGNILSLG